MANSIFPAVQPVLETIKDTPMETFTVFVPERGKPYQAISGNRRIFAAFTEAAAHAAGLITRATAKAAPAAVKDGKGGGMALWSAIVGSTAKGHWAKLGRIDLAKGTVEVPGLNEFSARTNGTSRGYNTDTDAIKAVYAALISGGTVSLGDGKDAAKVTFGAKIRIMRPAKAAKAATAKTESKVASAAAKVKAAATAKAAAKPTTRKATAKRTVKAKVTK